MIIFDQYDRLPLSQGFEKDYVQNSSDIEGFRRIILRIYFRRLKNSLQ